jgi:hypothetical protein
VYIIYAPGDNKKIIPLFPKGLKLVHHTKKFFLEKVENFLQKNLFPTRALQILQKSLNPAKKFFLSDSTSIPTKLKISFRKIYFGQVVFNSYKKV